MPSWPRGGDEDKLALACAATILLYTGVSAASGWWSLWAAAACWPWRSGTAAPPWRWSKLREQLRPASDRMLAECPTALARAAGNV